MDTLLQDVRHAVRRLAKTPGFTLVAVVVVAVSIGANAAIFSVVNATLLAPGPFPEPERLVRVWDSSPQRGEPIDPIPPASSMAYSTASMACRATSCRPIMTSFTAWAEG